MIRIIKERRYFLRQGECGIRIAFGNKVSFNGKRSSGDEEGTSDGKRGIIGPDTSGNNHRVFMSFVTGLRSDLNCLALLLPQDELVRRIERCCCDTSGLRDMLSIDGTNLLAAFNQHVLDLYGGTSINDTETSFIPITLLRVDNSAPVTDSFTVPQTDRNPLVESIAMLFSVLPELLALASFAREHNEVAISQLLNHPADVDYDTCRCCVLQILSLVSSVFGYSTNSSDVLQRMCDYIRQRHYAPSSLFSWLNDFVASSDQFIIVMLLEYFIKTSLDSAITLICVRLLLLVSKLYDECLNERIAMVAWQAMQKNHGSPDSSLFPLSTSTYDSSSLICASITYLSSIRHGSHFGLDRCEPLFREALAIQPKTSLSKSSFQLIDCEAYDSFRLLCDVWWTHADATVVTNGLVVLILESWSVASLGNISSSSSANDVRRSGRKRTKVVKEAGEGKQSTCLQLNRGKCIMNRIDETNACKYLLFSLSLLPALMQMLQPSSFYIDPSPDGVGPFYALKLCMQVMIFALNDIESTQHLQHGPALLAELTPKLLKIIRSYLFGLQYSLNNSVTWRNEHDDKDCSIAHLSSLLSIALAVTSCASRFIAMITQLLLHRSTHGLPSSVQVSLPQLQLHIEKARQCVDQICAAHQIELKEFGDIASDWSNIQHSESVDYLVKYENDTMRSTTDIAHHERVMEAPLRRKNVELEEPDEFVVESASKGWGLYDDQEQDDSDSLFDEDLNNLSFTDTNVFDDDDDLNA